MNKLCLPGLALLLHSTHVAAFGAPAAGCPAPTCAATCDASSVELADYTQWAHEDGYWLGEYSYFDGNGDPVHEPGRWNYPYDHYKGFITGSVNQGSYSQRNVFLYPPQTAANCVVNSAVSFDGDTCGVNGGIKKFEADQTTAECKLCQGGAISGPYQGKRTTTELVGAGNALLYQVFGPELPVCRYLRRRAARHRRSLPR
jgi:hypothetical protein